jgi:hypothetical protein
MRRIMRTRIALLSLLSLPVALLSIPAGATAATASHTAARTSAVTTSSLGTFKPTFAGPAATGCRVDCNLLTGPLNTPSTAAAASGHQLGTGPVSKALSRAHGMALPALGHIHLSAAQRRLINSRNRSFPVPSVSCQPPGRGCDQISTSKGGATSVKGLNAVDSAEHTTNIFSNVEPPDQGLCAGNGFVVEANNIGEILIFNSALKRKSAPISFDTIMGLTGKNWSSGGDISCIYDPANGGHWFYTQIVSASPESKGVRSPVASRACLTPAMRASR